MSPADHASSTSQFADLLLAELGADRASPSLSPHAGVAHALRTRLPVLVDEIDVGVVAAILEEHRLLSWIDDVRPVPAAFAETLERAVADVLQAAPRGTTPRQATAQLMAEVSRLLGSLVDPSVWPPDRKAPLARARPVINARAGRRATPGRVQGAASPILSSMSSDASHRAVTMAETSNHRIAALPAGAPFFTVTARPTACDRIRTPVHVVP